MNHDSFTDHRLPGNNPKNQLRGHAIISDQVTREGIGLVLRELERAIDDSVPGHIVEFGCYAGTTSLFIRRLLNEKKSNQEFHVYDSFDGLPEKTTQDNNAAGVYFEAGKLYVSKADFIKNFKASGLQVPFIHKGWFKDIDASGIPDQIAFAFLDGDFYGSIIDSLRLVWPRLSAGGIIVVDDFKRETLPGVERALKDFFQDKQGQIAPIRGEHTMAVIRKVQ